MTTVRRYVRAFIQALTLTLRGQKPPTLALEEEHADLLAWCRETVRSVDAVNAAIQTSGIDPKSIEMHIEGRDATLEFIIAAVRFHAAREFPHLIRSGNPNRILAIQAANLNDRFLVQRISEHEALPPSVKAALDALGEHLAQSVKA